MSLRDFLFAADALRLEEGVSWAVVPRPGQPRVSSPADNKERNAQAMQQFKAFQSMMGGMKKGRR